MRKHVILIVAVIVLLLGGGAAWYFGERRVSGQTVILESPVAARDVSEAAAGRSEELSGTTIVEDEVRDVALNDEGVASVSGDEETTGTRTDAAAAFDRSVVFRGIVTDREGAPVEGAEVEMRAFYWEKENRRTLTDAGGRFEFVRNDRDKFEEQQVNYYIDAWKSGYGPAKVADRVKLNPAGKTVFEKELVLGAPMVVTGTVVDPADKPVGGARVETLTDYDLGRPAPNTVTDANGYFTLEFIRAGALEVRASKRGFLPVRERVFPGRHATLKFKGRSADLIVQVVEEKSRNAVAGADVIAGQVVSWSDWEKPDRSVQTGPDGTVMIEGLPAGQMSVNLRVPGKINNPGMHQSVALVEGGVHDVTFTVPDAKTLRGTVRNEMTNEPIEGVLVKLLDGGHKLPTDTTNETGQYRLHPLRGDFPRVTAEKKGWLLIDKPLAGLVPEPDETELVIDLTMVKSVTISGHLVFEDGSPVTNGRVNGVPVSEEGAFQIPVSINSELRLSGVVQGYPEVKSEVITVGEEDITGIRLVVKPGLEISGIVRDHQGNPVSEARIGIKVFDARFGFVMFGPLENVTTDGDGFFRYVGLNPGEYGLRATAKGHGPSDRKRIKLDKGSAHEVVLDLKPNHFVSGKVLDMDDQPIESAIVRVHTDESALMEDTDSEGKFKLDGLPAGEVELMAGKQGYRTELQKVQVDRDGIVFHLSLADKFTIIGKVLDFETREPVRGFSVKRNRFDGPDFRVYVDEAAAGIFVAEGVTPGFANMVVISGDGYADVVDNITVRYGEELLQEREYLLRRGGSLTGKVVNQETGEPMDAVQVKLGDRTLLPVTPKAPSVRTSADGTFTFENLEPGDWRISIVPPPPFKQTTKMGTVVSGKVTDIGIIEVNKGGTLHVRVLKNPGGVPISDVPVELRGFDSIETNAMGIATFTGVPEGGVSVHLPRTGLRRAARLDSGNETTVDIVLGSAELRIGVIDEEAGEVQVFVGNNGGNYLLRTQKIKSETQFQDYLVVKDVAAGSYDVQLAGLQGLFEKQVDVPETGVVEVTFDITGFTVEGKVLDERGEPLENGVVHCITSQGTIGGSVRNGRFIFSHLKPGNYRFEASSVDHGEAATDEITVNSDIDNIVLTLPGPTGGRN